MEWVALGVGVAAIGLGWWGYWKLLKYVRALGDAFRKHEHEVKVVEKVVEKGRGWKDRLGKCRQMFAKQRMGL